MAQKFTGLDEAAEILGVSKDRLTKLREAGKVRGYRDGASWKFRAEDIEKYAEQGVPQLDPGASDLSLDVDDEADLPTPATSGLDLELAEEEAGGPSSGLDLDLTDDELLPGPASDLNLDDIDEPTVPANLEAEIDSESIDLDSDSIDLSDSILLSEAEIGSPSGRPPSTIIGKMELDPDGDLGIYSPPKAKSDSGAAKVKPPSDIIEDELEALDMDPPGPSADFEGLEELEVDLEAESSRILSPEDLAQAKNAAAEKAATTAKKAAEMSDLELAPSDSDMMMGTSDIGLGGDAAKSGSIALTGLSALELEDDDDEVLGEGSDVTLSSESSGINIISPSDSGLALDEVDLSGSSAMGSSLDLGNLDDDEVNLEPMGFDAGGSDAGAFQLTPLGEDGGDDEKDSSQVIALDDVSEEDTGGALLGSGFGSADDSLAEGFADVGLATGVVAQPTSDTPFSLFNVLSLSGCILMLTVCGMMMFDLLRNMWSWGEVASFNSSLLEVLKF